MITSRWKKCLSLIIFFIAHVGTLQAASNDWDDYAYLLSTYVKPGKINGVDLSVVDYAGIKQDERFKRVAKQFAAADLSQLVSEQEKLAFYINAYNFFAIKMVTDHWPVKSIRDIGSFFFPVWKKDVGMLAGKPTTLHIIEHEILRKMGEPRIHFAIVCASVSCPDLLNEPYRATRLEQQLNQQTILFLSNKNKGVHIARGEIRVSKIFDWFEEDFEQAGGIEGFVRQYQPNLPDHLEMEASLDYDWQVNAARF